MSKHKPGDKFKPEIDEDLADFGDEFVNDSQEKSSQKPAGALEHPSYEALEAKLNETEAKMNEYWDKFVRSQAEMKNVQIRAEKDLENAHKYGIKKLLEELIPVLDGIEEGLKMSAGDHPHVQKIREGMELTLSMLLKIMHKFGVTQIDPLGEKFDPNLHEAMGLQEQAGAAPNTVIQVLQKGYQLHDRLIRPARVFVAK